MLQNYVAELESENCKLKAAAVEASEDYEVLQLMNTSLLSERNVSHYQCKDLEDELKKIRSASATSIAALEAKIKTAKAHNKEVAAAHDKRWSDFEAELTRDLMGCGNCTFAMFRVSEACARQCPRAILQLQTTSIGFLWRLLTSQKCSPV
jgi:hypothetical protein